MSNPKSADLTRRRVFAGAGTVAGLAAVAAALPGAAPGKLVAAAPLPAPDKGGGYQATPHVLHYYQTARV